MLNTENTLELGFTHILSGSRGRESSGPFSDIWKMKEEKSVYIRLFVAS